MNGATKTEVKRQAQALLMNQIARTLGYWQEYVTVEDEAAFRAELKAQADRIARIFGYDEAWSL